MKQLARHLIVFSGLLLVGCSTVPPDVWYQEGVTGADQDNATLACKVEAAQMVPANMQVGVTPSYTMPVTTQCNAIGTSVHCNQFGGQTIGGNVYSYDANKGLRDQVFSRCMQGKGYRFLRFPLCTPAQAKKVDKSLQTFPPLQPKTCLVRTQDGRFAFSNP